MIGNLRCCNNIHWGTRICVTVQWMSVDCMPLSPAKLNLIWTAVVNSRVMTGESQIQSWGIASVHPLHYFVAKNTQLFKCIWQINTWMIWIVLLMPHCYKTSFSSGGCFCAFEILVALATEQDLVAVLYTGSLGNAFYIDDSFWDSTAHVISLHCLFW